MISYEYVFRSLRYRDISTATAFSIAYLVLVLYKFLSKYLIMYIANDLHYNFRPISNNIEKYCYLKEMETITEGLRNEMSFLYKDIPCILINSGLFKTGYQSW